MCLLLMEPLHSISPGYVAPDVQAYHFCMRFPRTQRTISDLSHSISCEGSYPRVALPVFLESDISDVVPR